MNDYCERPEFFSERTVTAKKNHRCEECRKIIYAGEKYEYFSGKTDGDFWTAKQHVHCASFCRFVNHKINLLDCSPFGFIEEDLRGLAQNSGKYGELARLMIWFYRAIASGCNERFGLGEGI